jgi:hypothetical protein
MFELSARNLAYLTPEDFYTSSNDYSTYLNSYVSWSMLTIPTPLMLMSAPQITFSNLESTNPLSSVGARLGSEYLDTLSIGDSEVVGSVESGLGARYSRFTNPLINYEYKSGDYFLR